jgi:hypothetical protein
VGFVVDKVALEQIFCEYFGFPCQFSFHLLLPICHLSSGAGTIGQLVADVPNELSLTPHQKLTILLHVALDAAFLFLSSGVFYEFNIAASARCRHGHEVTLLSDEGDCSSTALYPGSHVFKNPGILPTRGKESS